MPYTETSVGPDGEALIRELTTEEVAAIRGSLDEARAERLATAAGIRWQGTQTFTYDGVVTHADRAIAAVTGKLESRRRRGLSPEVTEKFKLSDTEWRDWDEAQLQAFGLAIDDYIQPWFDHESDLAAAFLAAASYEDLDAIDIDTGWPA